MPEFADLAEVSAGTEGVAESSPGGLLPAAHRLGWSPTPAQLDLLTDLEAQLVGRDRPRLAVLVDDDPEPLVEALRQAYPDAVVLAADAQAEAWTLHPQLAAAGPFDVVIDHGHLADRQLRNFRNTLLHVRPGGVYVVSHVRGEVRPVGEPEAADRVLPFIAALVDHQGADSDTSTTPGGASRQFVNSPGRLVLGQGHLMVVNRTAAAAKLREKQMNQVIELSQGAAGSVLHLLPATTFKTSSKVRHSSPPQDNRYRKSFKVPEMSLREYPGVVCGPAQVAFLDNLILPDTYRHNAYERLTHRRLTDIQHYFVQQPADTPTQELSGTYFYLDSEYRRHFGHLMTEQLSRLWAWRKAKERYPDLKALLSINPKFSELSSFEKEIFGAAGVPPEDLVTFVEPVRVERLIGATPMLSMPDYVHPELPAFWTEVGDRLAAGAPDRSYPERIFISRSADEIRPCHNAEAVEELFSDHGFEIVRPERLPLAEQVTLFRQASVVAGFAGSGLLTLCYCAGPKRLITLAPESYVSNNEYLIGAVRGFQMDRVVSAPDIAHPPGGFSWEAFYAGFTFDFDNEGRFLRKVLRSLDTQDDPPGPTESRPAKPAAQPEAAARPGTGRRAWQRAHRLLRGPSSGRR